MARVLVDTSAVYALLDRGDRHHQAAAEASLNLFLASYRFERPLLEVCRASLPLLAIRAASVLLITYLPALTTYLPPR